MRTGPPVRPRIFIGNAMISNPFAGSLSRFAQLMYRSIDA